MAISQTSTHLLRTLHFSRSTTARPLFTKGRPSRRSHHNVNSTHPSMTWFTSCRRRPRDRLIPLKRQMRLGHSILRTPSSQRHLLHLCLENLYLHREPGLIVQTLPPHILAPIASNLLHRQKRRLLRQNRRRLLKGINARRACSTWPQLGEVDGPHRRHRCPNHSNPRPHRPERAKPKVPRMRITSGVRPQMLVSTFLLLSPRPEKAKPKVPRMRITSGVRPQMLISTFRLLAPHPERLHRYYHRHRRAPRTKTHSLYQMFSMPSPCQDLPLDHRYSFPPRLILPVHHPLEGLCRHLLSQLQL